MGKLTKSYSHAAPYIREQILNATSLKLTASTQRDKRSYSFEAHGLIKALDILLRSPEGEDSPAGYPEYHGFNEAAVLAEIERYVGGEDRMLELGFKE